MAPTVLTTSLTSGGYHPADKSQIATMKKDAGLNLDADGSSTPYSATSTAVSEAGDKSPKGKSHLANAVAKAFVDSNLPAVNPSPTDSGYYSNLLASSYPTPETKAGTTVFCSGVDAFEAFAVKHSESVWVYDDAVEVGFGARVAGFNSNKVHQVQTREGAGLELAGYSRKTTGKLSVFASIKTLPYLLPSLDKIQGDIVINISTVTTDEDLKLVDGLYSPGVMKNLTSLPEGWDVVFSLSGEALLATGSKVYGREPRKTVHVVSCVSWSREIQKLSFPAPEQGEIWTVQHSNLEGCNTVYFGAVSWLIHNIWDAGLPPKAGLLEIKTFDPSPEKLYSALATPEGEERKTVSVLGATKADADALKAVFLSALYSASGSSKLQLPIVKSVVATKPADLFTPNFQAKPGKVISFYTSPVSPTPELLAHLFLSSPSLNTRLAQFGSSAARGVKSILAIAPSDKDNGIIEVDQPSDVTWVNDANVLKSTDVLSSAKEGSILVLELPWSEEEVAVKLTRSEIATIKEKKIRVFLLDLAAGPVLPIQEQVAFLLLYTGSQKLSQGVWKVLDAFHSNQVAREDVEAAQAALVEVNAAGWEVPELEEGKTEKAKAVWEWDALPGRAGVVDVQSEAKPASSAWQLAARHLFFREAFAVPEAKVVDTDVGTPGVAALRPSTADETFLVTVSENRRLTPATYDRNVFHLELDTSGTGLKYEIGEAIGIHGWNDTQEVLDFCAWYGLQPDDLVTFPNPLKSGTMETRTIFQLLQQNVDLFGRPGKAFYAALSKIATAKADAMTLKFISAPEGAELFKRMAENETVTFADVLFRFKTARPSIEELVGLIPEIKPRHYSIASSNKAVGDKVELLIVTVDWVNSKGSPRFGQCTRYLAALAPGAKVTVSIKPSVMKLPPDNKQPIIMAGLGTGAAPFRAFMQHRAWQRTQGIEVGPLIYYFGSRYRSQEYLYGEEIEAYIASGIISHAGLAFSRDSDSKTYIQHKMSADKKMLAKLLKGQGSDAAYFYLCGPTWPVPDVFEALVGSLTEDGMERKQAEEFIEELKEEERYVLEVY